MMKWEQAGTYIVIKENLVESCTLYISSTSNNNTVVQQLHFCNFREYTAFALDFDLDFFLYIWSILYCNYYSVLSLDQVLWSRLFCPVMQAS